MCFWYRFSENVISDIKGKGYDFNHMVEMNLITIVIKRVMSYDFYFKHGMCALERKLSAMINKNKNLINKIDRNWRHILNKIFKFIVFN